MRRLPLIPLLLVACGRPDAPALAPSTGHLEAAREVRPPRDDAGDKDPKSSKARELGSVARWVPRPEILGAGTFASEERGTFRTALAGIRVQRLADGSVLTSEDRIRDELLQITQIPRWLGSGYLFLTRNELSVAAAFTAPRKTILSQPGSLQRAFVGTDRIFVTTSGGAITAFDARTFVEVPTETLPGVPWLSSYAAKDAARAIAVFDLLGPVRTTDGGKTWQRLPIAAAISKVDVIRDTFLLQEASENGNNANTLRRFVVDEDGSARLAGDAASLDAVVAPKSAGKDLLVAAIERGVATASTKELEKLQAPIPTPTTALEEGRPSDESREALVVDGADLVRLDLRRGAILERAAFAFPPGTGRCVGTTLATQEFAAPAPAAGARPPGTAQGGEETASTNAGATKPAVRPKNAVGFLCEGADGGSWIYRLNDGKTPVLLRQFKHGRTIVPSGNGLLVVKGPCAVDGRQQPAEHRYCLFEGGEAFRDVDVRGDVGGERLVALGRGRLAVITPSHGVLTSARLTVLENGTARTVPLEFKDSDERARQDAKSGLWLDGFQEIAPGILAGWAELGGYYTGIRFDLTGSGTLYRAPSDRGNGTVGGRYGFFRSLNLRSFETTDFGKTWKEADAPALVGAARPKSLACSDVGCSLPGWLRVGWGVAPEKEKSKEIAKIKRPSSTVTPSFSSFRFVCERGKSYVPPPPRAEKAFDDEGDDFRVGRFRGGFGYGGMGGPNEELLVKKLTAFGGSPAPILGVDDRGAEMGARRAISNESTDSAHIYAWGPKGTDFTQSGQLEIRWTPLYAEGLHPRRTARVRLPQAFADLIPGLSAFNGGGYANFTLVDTGDDRHALLHTTRYGMQQGSVVALLDATGAPTLVRREGGDPLPPIEDATRLGGRLYVSAQPSEFPPESVLYEVDGGTAREVARFPRYTKDGPARGQQLRLARSTDGNRLGLVVTGRPASVAGTPSYWVVPFTPDTREFGTPFYAGDNGFRNFRDVPVCSAADDGYSLDMPIPTAAALDAGGDHVSMSSLEGRVRLSSEKLCIEALQGLATHEKNTFGWTAGAGPAIPLATLEGGEGRIAYSCRSARP